MRTLKYALGAAAAALIAVTALPASAATVITPVAITNDLGTINAFQPVAGTTYDFTFSLPAQFDPWAQRQASLSVKNPFLPSVAEPISFDLYSGSPTAAHALVLSSGVATVGANLETILSTGSYYLELTPSDVAQFGELVSGSIALTAVPEPTTWAMMLVGIGGLGMAMRSARRNQAAVAAA